MHRLNWKFCSRGARVRDNTHLRVPVHPPLQVCNIGAPEERRRLCYQLSVFPKEFGSPAEEVIPPGCTIGKRSDEGLCAAGCQAK